MHSLGKKGIVGREKQTEKNKPTSREVGVAGVTAENKEQKGKVSKTQLEPDWETRPKEMNFFPQAARSHLGF